MRELHFKPRSDGKDVWIKGLRCNHTYLPTIGKVKDYISSLSRGDLVCIRERDGSESWHEVERIRNLGGDEFTCYSFDWTNGNGAGGHVPVKVIRK